jgi:anti-sigma B factor antagonist
MRLSCTGLQIGGTGPRAEGGIMKIEATKEGNAVVMSLKGRLDAAASSEFETALSDWISKGSSDFLLNFSGLEYISSAGLRSILATSKKLKEKNGKLVLAGLHGPVEEVFKISGFMSIFRVFATVEAALKES